jgi:polyisoprenyl-phosphate glycosyltransferase
MEQPEFSVVIPVYRSEQTLDTLCNRLIKVFDQSLKRSVEIILVDDCSPDGSWKKMRELHSRDERIKVIRLARNFGQHNALLCGFSNARGAFVITMDDDLQHPPEEIPKLINAMDANPEADVVMGAYISKRHSWLRNLGTQVLKWIYAVIFKRDPRTQFTSFRLIRALIIHAVNEVKMEKPRVGHLIQHLTTHIITTPVHHDPRKYGKSGYTFGRLIKDFISNILNNSALPLKVISYMGFFSAFLSFALGLYYLYRYFYIGISVAGFTTLVLLILFYFGVTLFSMGIVGEYLIRIINENKRMPQFVVREKHL